MLILPTPEQVSAGRAEARYGDYTEHTLMARDMLLPSEYADALPHEDCTTEGNQDPGKDWYGLQERHSEAYEERAECK